MEISSIWYFLSGLTLLSALMVVFARNPIHSVLYLVFTFFCISGHYVLLNAQFLMAVNIIVYAGAIMVLFLFVSMLMNLNAATEPNQHIWMKLAGVIAGGCFLVMLVSLASQAGDMANKTVLMKEGNIGLIKELGKTLFSEFVIPFELTSVLFLSAMVGAVVLGKKDNTQ
jgi:NADH-quinone oxidoreductase subunit J